MLRYALTIYCIVIAAVVIVLLIMLLVHICQERRNRDGRGK